MAARSSSGYWIARGFMVFWPHGRGSKIVCSTVQTALLAHCEAGNLFRRFVYYTEDVGAFLTWPPACNTVPTLAQRWAWAVSPGFGGLLGP